MATEVKGRYRSGHTRTMVKLAAVAAAAALLAACSSTADSSSTNGGSSATSSVASVPQASPAALQATIKKLMMSDTITYDSLNPVMQRAINKLATPMTDAQYKKLQECLQATSCETGNPGKLTVAWANDGINPWRQNWRAVFTMSAIESPEVGKIIYNYADNVPGWIANVNSLIAQKVDILQINSIFGAAILPAIQAAKDAGVTVISAGTPLPPEVKALVDGEADDDLCTQWQDTADALIKKFPSGGTYGLYTGVPGNASAAAWQPCLTKKLDAAGWKKVIEGFTNWTEQGMAQQGNALYASGKNPDFIAYDYTLEDFANPYIKAGKNPPLMATDALNTAFLKVAKDAKDKGITAEGYISCARDWYAAIGMEYGLYIKEGKKQDNFVIPSGAATVSDLLASYDPAMPANAPIPHPFTPAQEQWILSAQS